MSGWERRVQRPAAVAAALAVAAAAWGPAAAAAAAAAAAVLGALGADVLPSSHRVCCATTRVLGIAAPAALARQTRARAAGVPICINQVPPRYTSYSNARRQARAGQRARRRAGALGRSPHGGGRHVVVAAT
jgi:hypothetical protein